MARLFYSYFKHQECSWSICVSFYSEDRMQFRPSLYSSFQHSRLTTIGVGSNSTGTGIALITVNTIEAVKVTALMSKYLCNFFFTDLWFSASWDLTLQRLTDGHCVQHTWLPNLAEWLSDVKSTWHMRYRSFANALAQIRFAVILHPLPTLSNEQLFFVESLAFRYGY
jgi:hypothetical protein